ncbi:acyl-CoA dehydrogenase family protein [Mycolicibacterium sp. S2-37]|uniref:acyl-CoA dehydrogenase family protein n=1 Tax=Mycolicibacterium sp. S2-37 TaxID=2810297 RepID=UPI001A951323|nr:acyl-CoA dehydrogenase family protein [Mycolicibacterium sp. S2-37]MBO0679937.1 acyl-CoA dehydrogenase family protein [Mycolicibacterium sp. S2-37]
MASAEFTFTDEQQQLLDAVRRFCAEHFDEATVRTLMESDPPFDRKVWARLGTELGVLGLSVPETDGGVGGSLVDQAVAVEQFGATLACGPLFGTVYLAVPALVAASRGEARDALLTDLVEGTRTAAFAASADTVSADGTTLSGELGPVVDAGAADVLLVAATGGDGVGLYAVDTGAEGVERTPLVTLDLTRPQAAVTLTGAAATLIAGPEEAQRVIEHALHVGSALLAVEQVGAAAHLLDVAVDYAKSRLQFGRPIGSFQAVKHRLADMLVDAEHARSTAYHAVWALTDGSDDAELSTAIAQATCSAALSRIAADTIQVLGGIGFTWEHEAHLYFKRAVTNAALLGSAEQHRDRVAALVLDDASADRAPRVAAGVPG